MNTTDSIRTNGSTGFSSALLQEPPKIVKLTKCEQAVVRNVLQAMDAVIRERDEFYRDIEASHGLPTGAIGTTHQISGDLSELIEINGGQ